LEYAGLISQRFQMVQLDWWQHDGFGILLMTDR